MTRDEIMAMAREAGFRTGHIDLTIGDPVPFIAPASGTSCIVEVQRFAALVAAKERERIAAQLVAIGDGYGVRDQGLDQLTYSRMRQTAYEHAAVVMTNGSQWSALTGEELAAIRARGTKEGA